MPNTDIKRALREAGFEIYRAREDVVHVAERVRENLIMDSGVRLDADLTVSFYVRAEQRDFPGEQEAALYDRARALGGPAVDRGFVERRAFVTHLEDPSDVERVLDHWYQVQFDKTSATLETALDEVRFAFSLLKQAKR